MIGSHGARVRERLRLGGVDVARRRWLPEGGSDLAYALRSWRKAPGFAITAVLTLALGMGAVTAMFGAMNAVVFQRWLPGGGAGRLVYVWTPTPRLKEAPLDNFAPSYGAYRLFRSHVRAFADATLFSQQAMSVETSSATERLGSATVRPGFFQMLGATPVAGRTLTTADAQPGAPPVAVISVGLARAAFGGARAAVGHTLVLDGKRTRVAGVLAEAFNFPSSIESPGGDRGFERNDVWLPLVLSAEQAADMSIMAGGGNVLARLRPGAQLSQAQAEAQALMPQVNAAQPARVAAVFGRSMYAVVQPFEAAVLGGSRRLLGLLLAAALLVLLIVCANVANLLLVRAADRRHEWCVRAALGASRARLLRQMLAEALLLALLGWALGLALAEAALRLLIHFNPGDVARLQGATLDVRAAGFGFALSLASVLVFGLGPAWSAGRMNLSGVLQAGGRGAVAPARRGRKLLTVAEAALAMVLLAGAGLLLASYAKLMAAPRGFSSSTQTASIQFNARYAGGAGPPQKLWAFYDAALARLRALPGVRAAALASDIPLNHSTTAATVAIEGRPALPSLIESHSVSTDYFRAMDIPLLQGRGFTAAEERQGSAVIVSQAFARQYFPGQKALGQHVCLCEGGPGGAWPTVVGVASDVRHFRLNQPPPPQLYTPLGASSTTAAAFVLRSSLPPAALGAELRAAIRGLDPALAVGRVQSLGALVSAASAPQRFRAAVFTAFGGAALLLAALGLYGVLAYGVRQRRAEFGVRMALGANRGGVMKLVLGEGMLLALAGIVLGAGAALGVTRLLASELYGVSAANAWNLAAAAAVLALVALAACLLPAWRASRTDPIAALRQE